MEEEWKDIKGYEGYYQVSNLGRVASIPRTITGKNGATYFVDGKILSATDNGHGYKTVMLNKDSKRKRLYVHRLVAESFLPNPNHLKEVNHINEIRDDNRLENLEWISTYDNRVYGNRLKKVAEALATPVKQYDLKGQYIQSFSSIKEASRKTGIADVTIGKCVNNSAISAGGFIWRSLDDENITLLKNNKFRSVDQYDLSGNYLNTYETIKSASESVGSTYSTIVNSCNNIGKKAGGFYWTWHGANFEHPIIIIKCLNKDTDEIIREFSDFKTAADYANTLPSEVKRCCDGRIKTLKGFKWIYSEKYINNQGDING